MFLPWHSCQVFYSVVIFDSIKVMDDPAFRQRLIIGFFPYENMLASIKRAFTLSWVPLFDSDVNVPALSYVVSVFPVRILPPFIRLFPSGRLARMTCSRPVCHRAFAVGALFSPLAVVLAAIFTNNRRLAPGTPLCVNPLGFKINPTPLAFKYRWHTILHLVIRE